MDEPKLWDTLCRIAREGAGLSQQFLGDDHANQPEDSHEAAQRPALALVSDHATEDVGEGGALI